MSKNLTRDSLALVAGGDLVAPGRLEFPLRSTSSSCSARPPGKGGRSRRCANQLQEPNDQGCDSDSRYQRRENEAACKGPSQSNLIPVFIVNLRTDEAAKTLLTSDYAREVPVAVLTRKASRPEYEAQSYCAKTLNNQS